MKALLVPCFPGELGWELINYAPYVNYIYSQKPYQEVHVVTRAGREAIYPMGTHFYPIDLSSKDSMGNNGPVASCNTLVQILSKRFKVKKIEFPLNGCTYVEPRSFIKYKANEENLKKWEHIKPNSVVLCIRGRRFGSHKNWNSSNWLSLCNYLLSLNLVPVITGIKESIQFDIPTGCVNLWDQTSIGDLISIMQKSKLVIGQSTGPMHLAALCGIPHVVWGSRRIQERYLDTWNPHKTMVEYHNCGKNDFNCSFEDIKPLIDKFCKNENRI